MTGRVTSGPLAAGLVVAGLLAVGAAAAADPVKRLTARSGKVSAEVFWRHTEETCPDFRAKIVRAGRTLVNTSLPPFRMCDFWPHAGPGTPRVRDLDADGEPEVLIDLSAGGLRCCLHNHTLVYAFHVGRYTRTSHYFRNTSYALEDVGRDRRIELVSGDIDFSCTLFYCAPDAVLPIQIWRWQRRRLVDVTRAFPERVARDARALLRLYERARKNPKGDLPDVRTILPAYVADQYLLGRERAGWRLVERAYARGEFGRRATEGYWPGGRRYVRMLRAFFRNSRYTR